MTKVHLPLQLRTIEARIECELRPCGDDCLLHGHEQFVAAVPGGMGRETRQLVGDKLLFRTRRGTIIKRRKHLDSAPSVMFGLPVPFNQYQQTVAFELLREHQPAGISLPRGECACSYEFDYFDGELVSARVSMHAPLLAQKYRVRIFANRHEALRFLRDAWDILARVHALGLRHGDPTHYNFLIDGGRTYLIDLDDTIYSGEPVSGWDLSIFFLHCAAPVLGDHYSADGVSAVLRELCGDGALGALPGRERLLVDELLRVGIWQALELHRAVSSRRETQAAHTALELHANDLHRRFLAVQTQADQQAQQLAEREAEAQSLRLAAEQRLQLVNSLTAEGGALRAQLADRERTVAELRKEADARLQLVQAHERSVQRLQAELQRAAAAEAQCRALEGQLQQRERVIADLKAQAEARLRLVEEHESQVHVLRARVQDLETRLAVA